MLKTIISFCPVKSSGLLSSPYKYKIQKAADSSYWCHLSWLDAFISIVGFREEWKTEGWRNQLYLLGAMQQCRGSGGTQESSRLGPAPNLSHPVSSLFHHDPSGLTCLICYSNQSRTLSSGISFPLKVIMRIDEIMFVKEFRKHQRAGAAWISRVAVSERNYDSLLLYYLPQRLMTIAPLPHPQPGCQPWGAQISELRSQCFP